MNKAGYRTRIGGEFSDTTVRRLLEDPITKGIKRSNYSRSTGDKKRWELKSPDEWIFQNVEPIVADDVWEPANAILGTRPKGDRPTKRAVHLFTGFVRCSCGGGMTVLFQSPSYTCQKCRRRSGLLTSKRCFATGSEISSNPRTKYGTISKPAIRPSLRSASY